MLPFWLKERVCTYFERTIPALLWLATMFAHPHNPRVFCLEVEDSHELKEDLDTVMQSFTTVRSVLLWAQLKGDPLQHTRGHTRNCGLWIWLGRSRSRTRHDGTRKLLRCHLRSLCQVLQTQELDVVAAMAAAARLGSRRMSASRVYSTMVQRTASESDFVVTRKVCSIRIQPRGSGRLPSPCM